jgi:hypothetical protein
VFRHLRTAVRAARDVERHHARRLAAQQSPGSRRRGSNGQEGAVSKRMDDEAEVVAVRRAPEIAGRHGFERVSRLRAAA